MSTKKRFSISPDLASGIRSTIQSAAYNHGQLHYDMMSLEQIEPDPHNPRKLAISVNELVTGLDITDSNHQIKLREYEALHELAESIKRVGIRNAIEVYKEGNKYRIVSGQRRYMAACLLGLKSVPVRISQKPDEFNLRYTQWVENINRQDLSLWEKFNNLIAMVNAYKKTNQTLDEQTLQHLLGVSPVQAYRYFCLLKADEKIIQLIQLGKLNNLKLVQELVSIKDVGTRNQIISWILSSKNEITSLANYRDLVINQKTPTIKIKENMSLYLGKISDKHIARELWEILLSDERLGKYRPRLPNIDWSSSKAITDAFKALFKVIEKELSAHKTT